ncbi:sodium solute symporter [Fragilaria crotonensis]|nr:sodium solute symporter [Fragilaria crotonensis]
MSSVNSTLPNPNGIVFSENIPPLLQYFGQESFFRHLQSQRWYLIVLGFGAFFSLITTAIVYLDKYYGGGGPITSENFNTAGRMVKTGLTATVIVSAWTWAATLLQSSNVAWSYGVSGPFWYASGATIQVILFGVIAISLKKVAPSAHTLCEIVNARWGRTAHKTFLFFALCANIIVTSMLLLGGAATTSALTGMNINLASFLIPWGVILYTAAGGLKATFLACYIHTGVIFMVLIIMVFTVYIKVYSSDQIYVFLDKVVNYSDVDCQYIFQDGTTTFWVPHKYICGPVTGNYNGSYLTMLSADGLMFGVINIIGNFGTVFVDQSYWQSAIAARPTAAARGYMLGGICWFAIPFSLATSRTYRSCPATSHYCLGGRSWVGPSCSCHSPYGFLLVAYDVYREYINPQATGEQILKLSRYIIVLFGLFSGCFSIALHEIGLNLGWVYLFMGIMIGSAVFPLWFLMTWNKASGTGAVVAAWGGLILALAAWLGAAQIQGGAITVDTLGTNEVMLSGNVVAIVMSGIIHYVWSIFIDPHEYDFAELDKKILLVENDLSGLGPEQQDPVALDESYKWITRRGYVLALVLIIIWPVLSIPAGVFSQSYFAFWVFISIAWGFAGALVVWILPVAENSEAISLFVTGVFSAMIGRKKDATAGEEVAAKEVDEDPAPVKTTEGGEVEVDA